MLSYKRGRVVEILENYEDLTKVRVELEDRVSEAVNYNDITGQIKLGDMVIVNTTAVELKLGTGGLDFVINNLSLENKSFEKEGHIMKMRYSPLQVKCMPVETEESPYHEVFNNFENLNGHICIVGTLHSMLAPIALSLKYMNPKLKINYLMTDGGCLPIAFSNTVRSLKKDRIIDNTITIGHAFGGDLESINIYNGLIASKEILDSDITIITMGPGIVGTGTKYGFSGVEQGEIVNAVNSLGGRAILVPRVGFGDMRERHLGISHHTRTVLKNIVKTRTEVVFHDMKGEHRSLVEKQLEELGLDSFISSHFSDGKDVIEAMNKFNYNTKTMGRSLEEEKDYFLTLGAVADYSNRIFLEEEM